MLCYVIDLIRKRGLFEGVYAPANPPPEPLLSLFTISGNFFLAASWENGLAIRSHILYNSKK